MLVHQVDSRQFYYYLTIYLLFPANCFEITVSSLITNTEVDHMYAYYDVARVQAYDTVGAFRLVVRIPLRGADHIMTLYRVEPLARYTDLLKRPIQIEPETSYFAVTGNRQCYALLEADIQICEHGLVTICNATFPLLHKGIPSLHQVYILAWKKSFTIIVRN
jgi:hypothetical protein